MHVHATQLVFMQVLAIYLSVYEQQAARNPQGLQQTSMLQCACFFHGHKKERQNTDGDNNEDLKQGRPAAGCLCGMQQTKGVFPVFQRVRCPGPAAGALCCTCLACCSLSTCTLLRPQEWLLNSSPSRRDRVSLADEARCRRQYCALIWEAGKRLQLCTPTCCLWPWLTGSVHPLYCKRHFACQCGMLKHKASCNSALCTFASLPSCYSVQLHCRYGVRRFAGRPCALRPPPCSATASTRCAPWRATTGWCAAQHAPLHASGQQRACLKLQLVTKCTRHGGRPGLRPPAGVQQCSSVSRTSKATLRAPQVVAAACLLLGAKAEETPKPLKEVVRVACRVRFAHQPAELEAVAAPVPPCAARGSRPGRRAGRAAAGGPAGRQGRSGRMRLAAPAAPSGRR